MAVGPTDRGHRQRLEKMIKLRLTDAAASPKPVLLEISCPSFVIDAQSTLPTSWHTGTCCRTLPNFAHHSAQSRPMSYQNVLNRTQPTTCTIHTTVHTLFCWVRFRRLLSSGRRSRGLRVGALLIPIIGLVSSLNQYRCATSHSFQLKQQRKRFYPPLCTPLPEFSFTRRPHTWVEKTLLLYDIITSVTPKPFVHTIYMVHINSSEVNTIRSTCIDYCQ